MEGGELFLFHSSPGCLHNLAPSSLRMQSQIAVGALKEININFYERDHDGLAQPYAKLQ